MNTRLIAPASMLRAEVDIRPIKEFAERRRVPSVLKFLMAREKDKMTPEEFCAKANLWLLLFDFQEVNGQNGD